MQVMTMNDDNSVFIGEKPFMNYVTSLMMQFTARGSSEVIVKARGKHISRAVDVVEVARTRFMDNNIFIKEVSIGSEEFQGKEGKMIRVSTLEITVAKR